MSKRQSYWRTERLAVEVLEPRTTPVGNVTASLAWGTLTLTGDQFANEISITTSAGNILVTGLNGTTVNGLAAPYLATSVSAITANLGAGNDSISITSVTLSGNLTINSGSGADLVSIDDLSAASMLIDLGTGNDSISIGSVSSVNVTGNLVIRGQSGHDTLAIGTNPPLGVTISGDLDVDMGTGNDSVAIGDTNSSPMASAVSVGGKVTIKLGSGNDSVAAVFFSVGNFAGSLVDGGAGPDSGFALDLATNSRLKTRSIP